ncbi:hypothetical protein WA026_000752 [Henosepilachna vigintioctopunctata]|uniref:Uncharacterized protein n=1 Tax=Henosepilachna vigintioctopunctata TaxID=420089 RepID=A0AAW1V6X9_9CUCU
MKYVLEVLLVYFTLTVESSQNDPKLPERPEFILPCNKSNPDINNCVIRSLNHLRPYLIQGMNNMHLPSIEPFKIDRMVIENGRGSFRIRAAFFNVTAYGASNYTIKSVKTDVNRYTLELAIGLPKIDIKGKYDVNGNVLLFPVRSKGEFWAIFLDVEAVAKLYGKEVTNKEGVRFMKIDKLAVDFRFKKSRFKIKDVINHGNIIGEAINQFINNNSEEIIKEMKPAAVIAISNHFKSFLNAVILQYPLKLWLPDA